MIKLIVAGGRDFSDYRKLCLFLDDFVAEHAHQDIQLIHGAAIGADSLAGNWGLAAKRDGKIVDIQEVLPDYKRYGKAAPLERNTVMANMGTHLIAFWNGESGGTKDMIDKARALGLHVKVYRYHLQGFQYIYSEES